MSAGRRSKRSLLAHFGICTTHSTSVFRRLVGGFDAGGGVQVGPTETAVDAVGDEADAALRGFHADFHKALVERRDVDVEGGREPLRREKGDAPSRKRLRRSRASPLTTVRRSLVLRSVAAWIAQAKE